MANEKPFVSSFEAPGKWCPPWQNGALLFTGPSNYTEQKAFSAKGSSLQHSDAIIKIKAGSISPKKWIYFLSHDKQKLLGKII